MRAFFCRKRFVVLSALGIGLLLRLWFIAYYPVCSGDGPVYADIARNWFLHGVYGFPSTPYAPVHATIIRLPGFPFFLGVCFQIFGVGNYLAIRILQAFADLSTCLLIAAIARLLAGSRAGWWALWLAALCPFTANYTSIILTETLELLTSTAAFYCFLRLMQSAYARQPTWRWTILLALSATCAALLRPDGALIGLLLYPAILLFGRKTLGFRSSLRHIAVCMLLTAIPFSAWTIRNWRVFHVFQPLTPRYANEPWESPDPGFNRWASTVCADFACTFNVYWATGSGPISLHDLPSRAFDSPEQAKQTRQLLRDYNRARADTPAIDARFAQLANLRLHDHPWKYRGQLPMLRLADMWLRPRTANLPIALRWWQYQKHPAQTIFSIAYAMLNFALLLAAIAGLARWPRYSCIILTFVLARCALLLTLEAPETRYTIECFPFILALAGVAFGTRPTSRSGESPALP